MNALINKIRNNLSLIILYRVLVIVFLVMVLFFNLLRDNFTGIKSIMEVKNSETFFDTLLPFVIINYLYFLTFSFFDKKFFTKHKQSHFILIILIFFIFFYFKMKSIYTGSVSQKSVPSKSKTAIRSLTGIKFSELGITIFSRKICVILCINQVMKSINRLYFFIFL